MFILISVFFFYVDYNMMSDDHAFIRIMLLNKGETLSALCTHCEAELKR